MDVSEIDDALRLSLEVWHPNCWTIQTTKRIDVGILGYGIHTTQEGRATTLFTFYADEQCIIDDALEFVRASPHIDSVVEMSHNYRFKSIAPPGNATRELLVDHDGTTQISEEFTARGFVYAEPVNGQHGLEYWTLLTNYDRETVQMLLDEIREERDAEITVTKITQSNATTNNGGLPLHRLSRRQREIFQLARDRGFYEWPKQTSAGELAEELGITTSTFHEHLHKAEAKLLGSTTE